MVEFWRIIVKWGRRLKAPFVRLLQYKSIKLANQTINFVNEGSRNIRLPSVSNFAIFFGTGIFVKRNIDLSKRPNSEVLLRKIIFEMQKSGYIDKHLSIIDIGCWIADNSIVWAQNILRPGKVIAIDPSPNNIAYGIELAEVNNVDNLKFVQAVCAEKAGIKLDFNGSIDHATFKPAASDKYILSTTIDEIVEEEEVEVGLFHIDVEGFELSVLKGAKSLIKRDFPIITFEQHISKENVFDIVDFLKEYDYKVFMINEVLPGNSLDCRNFIAFPPTKPMPNLSSFEQVKGHEIGVYSAVVGDVLLEV